jgi:muramoyltetrapeptide carboxypeptidase
MNRRAFVAAAGGLVLGRPTGLGSAPAQPLKPQRLRPGDWVGLVAPSGVADDARIERGTRHLEAQGFKVKLGRNIRAIHGGYAGTVAERVADLHAMFTDREVHAIWCLRGGSGASALLPHLDYALIRRHPKIFIGYSDATALHLAIWRKTGLVTFHGPVATTTPNEYAVSHWRAVLMDGLPQHTLTPAAENLALAQTRPHFASRVLAPGVAQGRLIGGNLSLVSALVGTPYAADFRRSLVFLEDWREPPYRIDRMLTQLAQHADLNAAAGYLLGVFERASPTDDDPSLSLTEVIDQHFSALRVPALYGASFGHIAHQFTLPIGIRARLDTTAQTLTLLEPAVVQTR